MESIEERDSDVGIVFNEKYKCTINKFKMDNSHLINNLKEDQNIIFNFIILLSNKWNNIVLI